MKTPSTVSSLACVALLTVCHCGSPAAGADAEPGDVVRDARADVAGGSDVAPDASAPDASAPDASAPDAPGADASSPPDAGASDGGASGDPCAYPALRTVPVATAAALTAALAAAQPGDRIELADGTYAGQFTGAAAGTAANPVVLCGARRAVLDGGSTGGGYGFHLTASYWVLSGFTVTDSQKGIVTDGASHCVLAGLEVYGVGEEGIHFRAASSDNVLRDSSVHDTGQRSAGYGEGVYIGSAQSHWADYSGGQPDRCDRNQVLNNAIGPHTTAECIDIKEGTTGGVVRGNTFSGDGISGANSADSWMDVKGNGYTIDGNTGSVSPNDGFQTHVVVTGWGNDNVFSHNAADVRGPGYGFRIQAGSSGNVVACDNTVTNAALGLANVPCR